MDGEFHRKRGVRSSTEFYYFFAKEFGWTKKEVDSQPITYLADIVKSHQKFLKRQEASYRQQKLR